MRRDVRTYPPRQDSVPAARRRAAWLAVAWGHPGLAADVALLTSELTTNALLHGSLRDRLLRVEISARDGRFRIAVIDPRGERWPEILDPAEDESYGRGLRIVSAVAKQWGAEHRCVGKTVWAELALDDRHDAKSIMITDAGAGDPPEITP
ncbi:ATP-binding protein [Streptomyces sp. NPDC090022]|uniref:ATP-binding protein n=1 Tax=Streptomyces sp. NPDC090022 TaxID=3365920 RepID=UPI00381D87F6